MSEPQPLALGTQLSALAGLSACNAAQCHSLTACCLVQGSQQLHVFGAVCAASFPTPLLHCAQSLLASGGGGKPAPCFPELPLSCSRPRSWCQCKAEGPAGGHHIPLPRGPVPTLPGPCEAQAAPASSPHLSPWPSMLLRVRQRGCQAGPASTSPGLRVPASFLLWRVAVSGAAVMPPPAAAKCLALLGPGRAPQGSPWQRAVQRGSDMRPSELELEP